MKTRSILIGLSSLLGLSLCSGIFIVNNSTASELQAAKGKIGDYYKKVTTSSEITDGNYLIVYETGKVAFDGSLSTLDAAKNTIAITFDDTGNIDWTENIEKSSFEYNSSEGTLLSCSGYYIGRMSNSNGFESSKTQKFTNSVYIASNKVTIKGSAGPCLKYNSSKDQQRFRYYKSGQQDISLFKLTKADIDPIYASNITITSNFDSKTIYDTTDVVTITSSLTPTDYNGDISYEFVDSNMSEFASIKKNDDLTCSLTPLKSGTVSIIAKASSSETEAISSNVLTLEIVEDMPKALEVSGQKTEFVDGDTFDFGDNFKVVLTYQSGAKKEIDSSELTVKLDNNEISESTVITENDNGKEITIECLGIKYAYKIVVTNAFKYVQVTDVNSLRPGDIIAIVSKDKNIYSGNTINDSYLEAKEATFGSKESLIANSFHFILDKNGDYWNLATDVGYLSATAVKNLEISNSLSSAKSANWTISIDKDGNATIANSNSNFGRILHNVSSKRFTTYTSETNVGMFLPQIYKLSNYAYTNGVKSFVNAIDKSVACDPNGEQSDFDLWNDIKTDYYQPLGNFDKISLKNFASNPSGDEIETVLSKYDYIVNKYDDLDDYLGRRVGDSSKAQLVNKIKDNNSATTITCLSLLGCSSLVAAGLFALRKKRHSN